MKAIICLIAFFIFLHFVKPAFAALTIYDASPSVINSQEDILTITASASSLQNTIQYIQIGLTKEGETSNYFGFTKNLGEEWYKYKSSPLTSDLSSYFYSFTPVGGVWNGKISAKVDVDDSGFKGPGNYILKLFKYITTSPSYSNTVTIVVNITSTPTPTNTPTPTPPPTPTLTLTPIPSKTPTPPPTSSPTPTLKPSVSPTPEDIFQDYILGESTESGSIVSPTETKLKKNVLISDKSKSPNNNFQKIFIFLGIVFISVCAILTFQKIKKGRLKRNEEE